MCLIHMGIGLWMLMLTKITGLGKFILGSQNRWCHSGGDVVDDLRKIYDISVLLNCSEFFSMHSNCELKVCTLRANTNVIPQTRSNNSKQEQ